MEELKDKVAFFVGTVVVVMLIGGMACGILECFSANTGAFGGILAIIPVLFLGCFVVWQVYKELIK